MVKAIVKKEDSTDEAIQLYREFLEYEKKMGYDNKPSFGTMNNLGKRNKIKE